MADSLVNFFRPLCLIDLSEVEADTENVSRKADDDVLLTDNNEQACGTEPSMTENTKDGSIKKNADLKIERPAGSETKKKSGASKPATKPVYIRIPLSKMFGNESESSNDVDQNVISLYKLIDRVPSYADSHSKQTEIRKRKSYIMSYNNETKNADWVYEILNKSTLESKCKEQMSFGKNEFKKKDYNQGHLAAAANHRWCQEAYHDTYLMSNMIPQNKSLNEGMWSTLEQHCRDFVKDDRVRNVHVYTGPIYPEKKKKKNKSVKPKPNEMNPLKVKAVPTHFYKVIIVENMDGTVEHPECYVMPNEKSEYKGKLEENTKLKEEAKIDNKELLKKFKEKIEDMEKHSWLTFIERDTKFSVQIKKTVKWTGEDGNGELHSVDIEVRLTPPFT